MKYSNSLIATAMATGIGTHLIRSLTKFLPNDCLIIKRERFENISQYFSTVLPVGRAVVHFSCSNNEDNDDCHDDERSDYTNQSPIYRCRCVNFLHSLLIPFYFQHIERHDIRNCQRIGRYFLTVFSALTTDAESSLERALISFDSFFKCLPTAPILQHP